MSKRPHISLKIKLAAALCTIVRPDETGRLVRVISHADAKKMTADQVLSVFTWDHYPIRFSDGGPCTHWNLEPRPILEHRHKTAKKDAPEMKKARKIAKRQAEKLLPVDVTGELGGRSERPKPRWPSRPMKSRGFPTKAERERAKAWREQRGR